MPFTLGDLGQAFSGVFQRAVSIGRASAQPLAAVAYTALVFSLHLCENLDVPSLVVNVSQDRLRAAIAPHCEAQQLTAGPSCPYYETSSTVDELLPWELGLGPGYLIMLGLSTSSYLVWTAAHACAAAFVKSFSPRPRMPPSMLTIWSGRRRLLVPSCILAFVISASCVALPVVKVFGEDMKLSDKAIILYGRRCSFGNADDLSCELLRRAAMYSGDASVSSRFLDFFYAVREADWHFTAAFLVIKLFSAYAIEASIVLVVEIWRHNSQLRRTPVAAPVALERPPHALNECEFCAATASPVKVGRT